MNYLSSNILIIVFSITIINKTFSQVDSIARNQIYLEAGGSGGYGSLNYEYVTHKKNYLMFALRVGIGSYHFKDYKNNFNPDIILPLAIYAYYGGNHKIDLGIGESFSNIVQHDNLDFTPRRISNFNTIFSIGYRYQKKTDGIIFRCAYTPIIEYNNHFRNWFGLSFGYSF